jgi:hypothetical protein
LFRLYSTPCLLVASTTAVMKHFKEEELIMYVYKDCTPALNAAINKALKEDIELSDTVEQIRRTVTQLDKLRLQSPSKKSIKAILEYAKKREG